MNRQRALGFAMLLLVALLFLWASVTGGLAEIAAALFVPSYLEEA